MTGQSDLGGGAVRLQIPAHPDQLGTARLFGAASARQFGADDEVAEDLRLAVSEACAMVLQSAGDPAALMVTLTPGSVGIHVSVVSIPDRERGTGSPGLRRSDDAAVLESAAGRGPGLDGEAESWGAGLLAAIVSGLSIDRGPDGQASVTFTLPLEGSGPNGFASRTG
jgi:anti-sigma regulatory factor (Ser/Thr protein kinase)